MSILERNSVMEFKAMPSERTAGKVIAEVLQHIAATEGYHEWVDDLELVRDWLLRAKSTD